MISYVYLSTIFKKRYTFIRTRVILETKRKDLHPFWGLKRLSSGDTTCMVEMVRSLQSQFHSVT